MLYFILPLVSSFLGTWPMTNLMINIYTSCWDVSPELDGVIVDARVFVLEANWKHQRNSNHLNFFSCDVNSDFDYDFDDYDDDYDDVYDDDLLPSPQANSHSSAVTKRLRPCWKCCHCSISPPPKQHHCLRNYCHDPQWSTMIHYDPLWSTMIHYDQRSSR